MSYLVKWEHYVALIINGGRSTSPPTFKSGIGPDGIKSIFITNIDYRRFKLCLLSILWRAHISRNPFFKKIDIGDNADRIRRMLLSNDPGEESEFKISIVAVKNSTGLIRMVLDPAVLKIGQGHAAVFFINGIFYFIDLIPNSDLSLFQKNYLTRSGTYEIALLDGEVGKEFLSAFGLPQQIVEGYFSL